MKSKPVPQRIASRASLNDEPRPIGPWGAVPASALRWICRKVENGALVAQRWGRDDGVELDQFPLADLSVETIRERWGNGTYQLFWQTTKDGKRTIAGRSPPFTLKSPVVRDEEVAPAPAAPPYAVQGPPDELSRALAHMSALSALKKQEIEGIVQLFSAMQQGRAPAEEKLTQTLGAMEVAIRKLAGAVHATGERLVAIETRLDALEADEGDDDEDDDERGVDSDALPVMQPGDRVGDVIKAGVTNTAMRKLPDVLDGVGAALKGFGALKQAEAEERAAKRAASTAPAPASAPSTNGAVATEGGE